MILLVSYGKTTKFNELPGWNWYCSGYVEWLQRGHVYEPPCALHLWTATQEQRDCRQPCSLAYRTTTCYMGSGSVSYTHLRAHET